MVDTDPQRKKTLAQFRIKINGSDASAKVMGDVIGVVVDQRLHLPAMFEIRIQILPQDMTWLDGNTFDVGKEVEIFIGYSEDETSLIVGKISAIEPDFDEEMPTVTIRGYDFSFGLHRAIKTRTFLNITDSDLASKVAQESGLTAKVEASTHTFEYLIQHGQTNYDFLLSRARRIGYEMFVDAKKLVFRKPKAEGGPVGVEWGQNLYQFRPRLSIGDQVDGVTVRGWDPKAKQAIVGTATAGKGAPQNGVSKTGSSFAKEVWGAAERVIIDNPVGSQGEADHLAQAELDELTASFIEAKGACLGNPKIKAGGQIEATGVGTKFSGTYYLTEVRHTISAETGHHTFFTACSQQPDALSTIMVEPADRPRWPMLVIGIVTNNKDPNGMGRVKVKFPWFSDDQESHWARIATPMAGADRGWHILPEVNDEVLCGFEHGEPTRPFVLGGLWNGVDKPPAGTKDLVGGDGKVNQRIWRSRTGHLLLFDDTAGEESIRIIDKTTKNHITITSSDNKLLVEMEGDIEVTSRTGLMKLTAEKDISFESKTGKISMKADVDVITEAVKGKIGMTAQTNVESAAKTGKIDMKCVNAELTASATAKMKANATFDIEAGANLTAKASAIAELNGSAMANLKGGVVNVQGSGVTNVTAPLVKIN
ncbi:MAG: VgrG-related protein [Thermomicrobiales bacterium]